MNAQTKTENLPAERKGVSYAAVDMDQMGAGGMLAPKSLGDVVAFAGVMARADLALPKHLRGNDGACLAVSMQAMRWEMDPFAVANKSYSVNDRLAYEAQLVAAVVHTRAPILGRPDYIYTGEGPSRRCQVVCVMADGETREYTSPRFDQITTKNSPLWKSDPDQQLGYFSIRSWARRHTPEVILGVYTPDEVASFRDDGAREVPTTGMRARLEARAAPVGGFDPEHIETELAEAATAEFTDAPPAADLDTTLNGDDLPAGLKTGTQVLAEREAARSDDQGPGVAEQAPPDGHGDQDPERVDWAVQFLAEVESMTAEEIDAALSDPVNTANFTTLDKAKPALAANLNEQIAARKAKLSRGGFRG